MRRLREIGFRTGQIIEVVKSAPLGDPLLYRIGETEVSLGITEAQLITVTKLNCHPCQQRRRRWGILRQGK